MFLVELLTTKTIRTNSVHCTVAKAIKRVELDQIPALLAPEVLQEGNKKHSVSLAFVAKHCIKENPKSRPLMDQVIKKVQKIVESAYRSAAKSGLTT